MKQLICEMCGSKDLLKQDGVFVCQSCGCRYSVEEARKMMIEGTVDVSGSKVDVSGSTVKVDTAAELTNLYQIARRARDDNNAENAARYYDMILVKDPKSWEAAFYVVYFRAMQCKIMDIRAAANSVANCLDGVLRLVPAGQAYIVSEIVLRCTMIANVLAEAAKNHYDGISYNIKSQYTQEYVDNVCAARDILYTCGDKIDSVFSSSQPMARLAATPWKQGIEIHKSVLSLFTNRAANEEIILSYEKKIGKYDTARWKKVQAEQNAIQSKQIESQKAALRKDIALLEKGIAEEGKDFRYSILVLVAGVACIILAIIIHSNDEMPFFEGILTVLGIFEIVVGAIGIHMMIKDKATEEERTAARRSQIEQKKAELKRLERQQRSL